MFVAYDRVRCISLPERKDRRRLMRRELENVGGKAEFFDAIRPDGSGLFTSRGMHGSFLSHQAVIREAARANESVLILEDDCNFYPNARGYPSPDCDVFYGSHWHDEEEMIGAHCMGFSRRAVQLLDRYLARYLRADFEPDPEAASCQGTIPIFARRLTEPMSGSAAPTPN